MRYPARWWCLALASAVASGCAREPLPCVSPVRPAYLAVSEIRGKQEGSLGQWVEVCNPTASRLPLAGVILAFLRLDGSGEREVLVRDRDIAVDPDRCAVLGLGVGSGGWTSPEFGQDGAGASLVFYDFSGQWDLEDGLYDEAVLEIRACGELVDRVVYRDLPERGTWSLDGREAPDAEINDDESRWCVDAAEPERGYPGTPGERNRECG